MFMNILAYVSGVLLGLRVCAHLRPHRMLPYSFVSSQDYCLLSSYDVANPGVTAEQEEPSPLK